MSSYILLILPPLFLAMIAQSLLKTRHAKACKVFCPFTGATVARAILDSAGLQSVKIERISGLLTDHYDPRSKTLRLSDNSYNGRNLAAVGIAAHEAGHAIQDGQRYKLMVIRQMAVPLASFGGNTALLLIILGMGINMLGLAMVGVWGFGAVALFQIVNLPVEYNASAKARKQLAQLGFITAEQQPIISEMLNAAALTYVAATLSAISQFLYFFLAISGKTDQR